MKAIASTVLFAAYTAAHSAVWTIEFDGTSYPARDARMDAQLGAKRVEWAYTNNIGTSGKPEPWQAITNVLDAGITCMLRANLLPNFQQADGMVQAGSIPSLQLSKLLLALDLTS